MEQVLRKILPVFSHLEGHISIFTWSANDCELIKKSDDVSLWGKPLTKVWKKWPCWDATNTVIIEHHEPRVDFNPQSNVIIPPFLCCKSEGFIWGQRLFLAKLMASSSRPLCALGCWKFLVHLQSIQNASRGVRTESIFGEHGKYYCGGSRRWGELWTWSSQ